VHSTQQAKDRRGYSLAQMGHRETDPWENYINCLCLLLEGNVKCPNCNHEIPETEIASHRARLMGKKGGIASGIKPRSKAQIKASKRNLEIWRKSRAKD